MVWVDTSLSPRNGSLVGVRICLALSVLSGSSLPMLGSVVAPGAVLALTLGAQGLCALCSSFLWTVTKASCLDTSPEEAHMPTVVAQPCLLQFCSLRRQILRQNPLYNIHWPHWGWWHTPSNPALEVEACGNLVYNADFVMRVFAWHT